MTPYELRKSKQMDIRRKWLVNVKEIHNAYYVVESWDAPEALVRVENLMDNYDGSELLKVELGPNFDTYETDAPSDTWRIYDDSKDYKNWPTGNPNEAG